MKSMSIKIKTLTPIWTGGVNGKCDLLHEAGIIGSMRWWYEAIVRGMGGYACDPVSDGCKFNTKGYENALNDGKSNKDALAIGLKEVCPACQLFGCTGWKRKFRVEIENIDQVKLNFINKFDNGNFGDINTQWWIKETLTEDPRAFYSSDAFSVKLLADNDEIITKIIALLKLIENIGSFGAKAQNGFGVIDVIHDGKLEKLNIDKEILLFNNNTQKTNYNEFRNLNNIYKYQILVSKNKTDYVLTGFLIKYYLRKQFKKLDDDELRNIVTNFEDVKCQTDEKYNNIKKINKNIAKKYNKSSKTIARVLFGSDLDDEKAKWASIIDVSHIYKKNGKHQFRVVCFLPEVITYDNIKIEFDRNSVIEKINLFLCQALDNSINIGEVFNGVYIFDNLFEG